MSMTASTASDTAPGRGNHPKGGYTPGMFGAVESADDFASVLGVPTTSIPLVKRKRIKCKSKDCPFDAILANDGHCPAHKRSWYPLKMNEEGFCLDRSFYETVTVAAIVICHNARAQATSRGKVLYTPKGRDATPSLILLNFFHERRSKYSLITQTSQCISIRGISSIDIVQEGRMENGSWNF